MPASEREQRRVAERRARVLSLRAEGATFEVIAAECGHKSAAAAQVDFNRAMVDRKLQLDGQADSALPLELERLDGMERQVRLTLAKAADGEEAVDRALVLRCVDRLLRISERRTGLLRLDHMKPIGWAGPDEQREEREDAVANLSAARARRRARAAARSAAPEG